MKPIYLDYNATTPIAPEVAEAMLPFLTEFGNPSSDHIFGRKTKAAVNTARQQVADFINCSPDEIYFTSGGSESNNWALKGLAFSQPDAHILTSEIEHPAIIEVCKYLASKGVKITFIPVRSSGVIDMARLAEIIQTGNVSLISVMHANNEVGTIQPIKELMEMAKIQRIPVHTDAAQSLGKIPVDVQDIEVDLLSIAGHKLYAPKGIGALFCREGVMLENLIHGAGHERGRRAGTENVLLIVALGKACELAKKRIVIQQKQVAVLRDYLQHKLIENIADVKINGADAPRLPNTLSISIRDVQSQDILHQIEGEIACSAGSACHAGMVTISPVLRAMQVPDNYAAGTLRLSLGVSTSKNEIETAARLIIGAVRDLRR
ncbi:MAG: aminotransferase class V-fold PLP-dependent enzyme [Calditrichaeota bacterium]|nr:MAG: aminotransferase class V-fold PLP-dependent enzyme [Calditrichota bacterium]